MDTKRGHRHHCLHDQAAPRTPTEVIASFFNEISLRRSSKKIPSHKASIFGRHWTERRCALAFDQTVALREGAHIHYRIALCDGCEPSISHCSPISGLILILDFVHANEYLWDAANSLLGEPVSNAWSGQSRTLQILSGQTAQVIAELHQIAKNKKTKWRKETTQQNSNYFERNLPYMDYPTYLSSGYPIASGVIEVLVVTL